MSEYLTILSNILHTLVRYSIIVGRLFRCALPFGRAAGFKTLFYDWRRAVARGLRRGGSSRGYAPFNSMIVVLPITIIAAVLILKTSQNAKIKGDAVIAMISVGSLAVGYLLLNKFSSSANVSGDVCSTLFGSMSILNLSESDVWIRISDFRFWLLVYLFCL